MKIEIARERVEEFCRRWRITEFALFGSVLTDEFRPDSDVDVLLTFASDFRPRLRDWLDMEDELAGIVGRKVDLVEKAVIDNPFVRDHVLRHHRVLYAV